MLTGIDGRNVLRLAAGDLCYERREPIQRYDDVGRLCRNETVPADPREDRLLDGLRQMRNPHEAPPECLGPIGKGYARDRRNRITKQVDQLVRLSLAASVTPWRPRRLYGPHPRGDPTRPDEFVSDLHAGRLKQLGCVARAATGVGNDSNHGRTRIASTLKARIGRSLLSRCRRNGGCKDTSET